MSYQDTAITGLKYLLFAFNFLIWVSARQGVAAARRASKALSNDFHFIHS